MEPPVDTVTISLKEWQRLKQKELKVPLRWTSSMREELVSVALEAYHRIYHNYRRGTVYQETAKMLRESDPERFGTVTALKVSTKLRELLVSDEFAELRQDLEDKLGSRVNNTKLVCEYQQRYPSCAVGGQTAPLGRKLTNSIRVAKMDILRGKMSDAERYRRWNHTKQTDSARRSNVAISRLAATEAERKDHWNLAMAMLRPFLQKYSRQDKLTIKHQLNDSAKLKVVLGSSHDSLEKVVEWLLNGNQASALAAKTELKLKVDQ